MPEVGNPSGWKGPWVYFMRRGHSGPIKIGCSSEPPVRMKGLQTANAEGLVLLGWVPGGRSVEAMYHRAWMSNRLSGEWFSPHPMLLRYIREVVSVCWLRGTGGRVRTRRSG